jgi:hypothetical protein
MTPDRTVAELLELLEDQRTTTDTTDACRHAEALADDAYDGWRASRCPETYERYLAAERLAEALADGATGDQRPSSANRLVVAGAT